VTKCHFPDGWNNDIKTSLHSVEFVQSLADPNRTLHCDGIPILLYVDDILMLHPDHATNAAIIVIARL